MSEQPEAAAKAAEAIFKRYTIEGMDACDEAIAAIITEAFQPILTSRDEQIAALTEERNEVLKQHRFDVQQMTEAYQELSAEHSSLRTRVAELERERDRVRGEANAAFVKTLKAQSELAQVRRSNSDVIDGFVDRLLSQLEQRGIKTDNWDGEDSVEVILADRIAALATQNTTI